MYTTLHLHFFSEIASLLFWMNWSIAFNQLNKLHNHTLLYQVSTN